MYSIIMADDEKKVRSVLKQLIHWEALQLELDRECMDGDELLHVLLRWRKTLSVQKSSAWLLTLRNIWMKIIKAILHFLIWKKVLFKKIMEMTTSYKLISWMGM